MIQGFKPLLAAPVDLKQIDYSNCWLSAKLDGIRAIVVDGVVVSRNLKPIRNRYIQHLYGRPENEHFDGELIVGEPTAKDCYQVTNSGVMSADGEPDVAFHVFDWIGDPNREYHARYGMIDPDCLGVTKVQHLVAENYDELLSHEQFLLNAGYEGVMLRSFCGPSSRYKFGRSTTKEGTLLKLKRFTDGEALVIGVEEEMFNGNVATTNALGRTERSSHAAGLIGKGRMGALICRTADGIEFKIGTGYTAKQREDLWAIRDKLPGTYRKYKSFMIGVKDAPRFPVDLGARDPLDM